MLKMRVLGFMILFVSIVIGFISLHSEVHFQNYYSPSAILKDGVIVEKYSSGSTDLYKMN
ncbi:hypothetical protein [Flammeovirga sp. SJP92]|uniref:hypothetical protein n=1 Tax=Flammeovirga sp. SJP92 TaxID=1775430 RepID=UPI001560CE7C|nr:hypothetical protein [Flammeovirga sp. SJP92]